MLKLHKDGSKTAPLVYGLTIYIVFGKELLVDSCWLIVTAEKSWKLFVGSW